MRNETKLFYMANPALNRELDTAAMVEEAMAAIMQHKTFSRMLMLDPFANSLVASAAVTVTFPDPELLELGAVPPALKGEVVRKQQLKILGAIGAAANQIKTGKRITYKNEEVKHEITISSHSGEAEAGGDMIFEVVCRSVFPRDRHGESESVWQSMPKETSIT